MKSAIAGPVESVEVWLGGWGLWLEDRRYEEPAVFRIEEIESEASLRVLVEREGGDATECDLRALPPGASAIGGPVSDEPKTRRPPCIHDPGV